MGSCGTQEDCFKTPFPTLTRRPSLHPRNHDVPREGGSSSGVLGTHDDYNLHWGHRLLSHYLHEAGIAHEHRENPGNHGGRANESYQVSLQWLGQVLDTD